MWNLAVYLCWCCGSVAEMFFVWPFFILCLPYTFSVVNTWVQLRGHCYRLRNFLTLSVVINCGHLQSLIAGTCGGRLPSNTGYDKMPTSLGLLAWSQMKVCSWHCRLRHLSRYYWNVVALLLRFGGLFAKLWRIIYGNVVTHLLWFVGKFADSVQCSALFSEDVFLAELWTSGDVIFEEVVAHMSHMYF